MDTNETIRLVEFWQKRLAEFPVNEIQVSSRQQVWMYKVIRGLHAMFFIRRTAKASVQEEILTFDFQRPIVVDRFLGHHRARWDTEELLNLYSVRYCQHRGETFVEAATKLLQDLSIEIDDNAQLWHTRVVMMHLVDDMDESESIGAWSGGRPGSKR